MLSLAGLSALLANGVALIPGGGSAVGIIMTGFGHLFRCKPCLYALGTAALCAYVAIHVHRADVANCDGRIESRLEEARQQALQAARDRDAGVRADLEKSYGPAMSALRNVAEMLQKKVDENAKRKPVATSGAKPGACKLGAAAGLLQPTPAAR